MENYIKQYQNYLKIRGLAFRTISIYTSILKKFLMQHPSPKAATQDQIIQFMLARGQARTVKQAHGALNHFFIGVLHSHAIKKIPQPKVAEYIPNILSEAEVHALINSIKNLKHEAIIQLIYSCALRVGEAINLKIEHISKASNQIKIVAGKGDKTAYVPIPEATKNLLRLYYYHYRPKIYLFEGFGNKKYSKSSIRKILDKALKTAGIVKHIRVHDLRHSRATHLLQNGMDIKLLKEILRHKKIVTTERYTHLTTKDLEKAMFMADSNIVQSMVQIQPAPLNLKASA